MKNWNYYKIVYLMAIIIFLFISCEDKENNNTPEITREFNDLVFLEKNIKLIDETGNNQNLKQRGIWQKIQNAFDDLSSKSLGGWIATFNEVYNTGEFLICIENNVNYDNGYYDINNFKALFCDIQILEYEDSFIGELIFEIVDDWMYKNVK